MRIYERRHRLIIPQGMMEELARTILGRYFWAPVFTGIGDPRKARQEIGAILKEATEKDGLLAAMLTQEIQIEISTTIKDTKENTIEFKKELIGYEEFLERTKGL